MQEGTMREIKFRAFLRSDQRLPNGIALGYEKYPKGVYEVMELNFANGTATLWSEKEQTCFEVSFRKIELMQYTGVNDKNGVEIYTDFLVEYFRGGIKKLGRIKLEDGRFVITRLWDKGVNYGARLGFDWWSPDDLFEVSAEETSFLKVAGTIYDHLWALDYIASNACENPEILKDK